MRHDPLTDLKNTLVKTLTTGYLVTDEEADRTAAQVGTHLTVDDVGGAHFELLNVTLNWKALCRGIVEGNITPGESRFAGLPLIGVLRWFDRMRYYHQFDAPYAPHRGDLDLDHVEAATCMALWTQEAEAQPYSPDDTQETLVRRINDVLKETAFRAIDKQRFQEAMDRLKTLRCLASRAGGYWLREDMKYQIPEE